jgi:hypothetical protein
MQRTLQLRGCSMCIWRVSLSLTHSPGILATTNTIFMHAAPVVHWPWPTIPPAWRVSWYMYGAHGWTTPCCVHPAHMALCRRPAHGTSVPPASTTYGGISHNDHHRACIQLRVHHRDLTTTYACSTGGSHVCVCRGYEPLCASNAGNAGYILAVW